MSHPFPGLYNQGIASTGNTATDKAEDEVVNMLCDLYSQYSLSQLLKEGDMDTIEQRINQYMSNYEHIITDKLNEEEQKNFMKYVEEWFNNPTKFDINCTPGKRSIVKVGGKRKTRKSKRTTKKRKQTRRKH